MIRVILIDDHTLLRQGVKLMLESSPDFQVVAEAATAAEGLQAIRTHRCELVVADFALPDHPAPWLLGQLRQLGISTPLLLLSQFTEHAKVRQILSLGAGGYLVKTATREELLQAASVVASGGAYLHPAVARALREEPVGPPLSARERAIVGLVVEGRSNPDIAARLNVSLGTVKGDLQALFDKFGVADRTRLAATALARGVVDPP